MLTLRKIIGIDWVNGRYVSVTLWKPIQKQMKIATIRVRSIPVEMPIGYSMGNRRLHDTSSFKQTSRIAMLQKNWDFQIAADMLLNWLFGIQVYNYDLGGKFHLLKMFSISMPKRPKFKMTTSTPNRNTNGVWKPHNRASAPSSSQTNPMKTTHRNCVNACKSKNVHSTPASPLETILPLHENL